LVVAPRLERGRPAVLRERRALALALPAAFD
jgi:hypothetical protein